jgi:hypothetical protein
MKRNNLTTAVLAGLAGVAGLAATANAALYLNPDGTGQVLIYPYYTVNAGNQTLISVVNTTNRGKAVKVRFLEGRNSKEVLDFNLYLSEFDVWAAVVFSTSPTSPGRLATGDTSCTAPAIPAGGVDFRNFAYAGIDSGPIGLERTREGHLEMIEMGEVNNIEGFTPLTWITHTNAGVPNNCAAINNAWNPGPPAGRWVGARNDAITPPGGGLFGNASIVNVEDGVMYAYTADAIEAFSISANHTDPGNLLPSLATPDTSSPGDFSNAASITFFNGQAVTAGWAVGQEIDAVSSVFMQSAIANEYALDAVLLAETEWVLTFPTKRFYVDQAELEAAAPIRPFTRRFPAFGVTTPRAGHACIDVSLAIFDREERRPGTPTGTIDFSPLPPEQAPQVPQLCFESQVITFGQADRAEDGDSSLLLGSNLYTNIEPGDFGFENGWLKVTLTGGGGGLNPHSLRPSVDNLGTGGSFTFNGQPVTGFAVSRYINANAQPGTLANSSGLWRHRGERSIVSTPAIAPQ